MKTNFWFIKNSFKTHFFLILVFGFLSGFNIFCQSLDFEKTIRIHLWAELDAYPESAEASDFSLGQFDFPIKKLRKTAPFLINAMVYGWNFAYTPYDKMRRVAEYFELTDINKIDFEKNPIVYKTPWIQDNFMHSWIEFNRTPQMIWYFNAWNTINVKKIQGRGKAPVSLGFEGIEKAASEAAKNAIRSYYREIIKNKPKEIDGKLIITKEPKIGISEGQYIVELDFFLETDRILKYTQF